MVQIRVSPIQFCCTVRGSHSSGASIAQWQSVGLVNQRSWVQSSLEAYFLNKSVIVDLWEKDFDPDVIRTRSLLIWSQTRYRCATESDLSTMVEFSGEWRAGAPHWGKEGRSRHYSALYTPSLSLYSEVVRCHCWLLSICSLLSEIFSHRADNELSGLDRIKDILSLPIWSACYQINGP